MTDATRASHAAAQPQSQQPGEFAHFYLNFLAAFGQHRPISEVAAISRAAVRHRDTEIARFDQHLQDLHAFYSGQNTGTADRASRDPEPVLSDWDVAKIESLKRAHGGLLVALFHYGKHRQVLADLAVMGVPFIAPVAKRAYFECERIAAVSTPSFDEAMRLVEVESPRVGRSLLQGLRAGRIGLIYVDGNMGPDGHKVEEGGVEVNFLGRTIRVKEGIARLSQSLQLPVLPLLIRGDDADCVVHGPLLLPSTKSETDCLSPERARQEMMQALYDQLAEQVVAAPSPWEFAFCLHRWIVGGAVPPAPAANSVQLPEAITLRQNEVALYERSGEQYWVHVGRQSAFRLPDWARGLYQFLSTQARNTAETERWLQAAAKEAANDVGIARTLLLGLRQRGLIAGD